MHEMRWHPLQKEWVIIAAHRQGRPMMPKNFCPFCKGAEEIPEVFDVLALPNKFASLQEDAKKIEDTGDELYKKRSAYGACEVIVYTSEHDATLKSQPVEHIRKVIDLWDKRYKELGAKKEIEYVFEFENKGAAIGVTLPHPHGQIYVFPFVPPKIQNELNSAKEYYGEKKKCIFCEILEKERKAAPSRIVCENEQFVAFIPFYARLPYEIHLYPKRHVQSVSQLTGKERDALAAMLKDIISRYDSVFGFELPYMMMLFQEPTDGKKHEYFHFHIEFRPMHRSKDKLKFLASVESGAGNFINDTSPEEKAKELRDAKI
ncbi:MAG: galactose-1-phosphate uridylyltransferase [Candidatus Thermoplasmatota archaeon]|nr:galactose-1-phosphate uridylyltransferase [Candidatus Thermoplasmatota archaeon]